MSTPAQNPASASASTSSSSSSPTLDPASDSLCIGLCTYRRPASLERLLRHLAGSASLLKRVPTVIVVDNDGSDPSVAQVVEAFSARSGVPAHYRIETRPGISAARNAVFDEAQKLGVRFLAMLDDDEWPSPQWLQALLREQARTGAAVVGGPVDPVFPAQAQHLEKYSRFWSVRSQTFDGKPFVFCTCNFLIDLYAIRNEARPLFDEAFGLSGGGDTVFFRKLFAHGHPMAWTDEARLQEEVPPSRASVSWIRQRRFRVGNHAVHWERLDRGALRTLAKSLGLTARLAIYPLLRREPESPGFGWLLEFDKVRGRFDAHRGTQFMEYARSGGQKAGR